MVVVHAPSKPYVIEVFVEGEIEVQTLAPAGRHVCRDGRRSPAASTPICSATSSDEGRSPYLLLA
jgi:hypothetical protein